MTPDERDGLEAKADRAMRRGELSTALELFQALIAAFPGDASVGHKLKQLKDNLQPMELVSAKSRFVPEAPAAEAAAPLDDAEARAARGDYAGAIATYRKALAARPDSELLRERIAELFRLAHPDRQASGQAQAPSTRLKTDPPRPTLAHSTGSGQAAPKPPEAVLADLLRRISARRKP